MATKSAILRELFARPGLIRIVGAHDALGAKLIERNGFDGVWASGLEISTAHAVPDANILTMSEYLAVSVSMNESVSIPIIADCDTGYGNSSNVIYMVRKYETAGIAAVCIEDKHFPKVNSFVPGRQELAPIAEFVGKIMAAKNAQNSAEFMVIARVEALIAGRGQDEAVKRARAYVDAGADAILIHSKSPSPSEIVEFAQNWDNRAPLVVVPTTYHQITGRELEELGIKMVIYANHGLRASIRAMNEVFSDIARTDCTSSVEERIAPMKLVFDLQGMPELRKLEQVYLRTDSQPVRAVIPAAGDHLAEYSMKHIAADIPMPMLDVNGKPLLQRQVEALNRAEVSDITVIGGYRHEQILVDGVKLRVNSRFRERGIAYSIMTDQPDNGSRTLIAYADILFDADVIDLMVRTEMDIVLAVDCTYSDKPYAPDRRIDLVRLAEPPVHARRSPSRCRVNRVLGIGKGLAPDQADGEFTGLALFSPEAYAAFREAYDRYDRAGGNGRFHESPSFAQASFTDMIQELIDEGRQVSCIEIGAGWMEIHSFDDYRLACSLVR